jgi:hypothetical protein
MIFFVPKEIEMLRSNHMKYMRLYTIKEKTNIKIINEP